MKSFSNLGPDPIVRIVQLPLWTLANYIGSYIDEQLPIWNRHTAKSTTRFGPLEVVLLR